MVVNAAEAGEECWEDLPEGLKDRIKILMSDVDFFARLGNGLKLRKYQQEVAHTIVRSIMNGLGLTIVVQFPRQSGKNELQALVEAYMLTLLMQDEVEIVKVCPTWKPQTLNAMRRLQRVLAGNMIAAGRWLKENGYIYRIGKARIFFLSGEPSANVVGATASTLLECDEAQDVLPSKWDKDFLPMAASTNATRVLWGTAWTSTTLLAREMRLAAEAEKADGVRRVFAITADEVAKEVPAYGVFVREQVARLGRSHPMIKSQYYGEEIDAGGGLFPPERLALMQGDHLPQFARQPGCIYALLLDVGGEDRGRDYELASQESAVLLAKPVANGPASPSTGSTDPAMGQLCFLAGHSSRRDSTALTVVHVDLTSLDDELLGAPTYRVVDRRLWTGVKHTALYGQIRALAKHWQARYVVVDATGLGAGLASFLERALERPGSTHRIIPFVFNQSTKSKLGWDFVGVVDSGRYKEPLITGQALAARPVARPEQHTQDRARLGALQALFFRQAQFCQYEVMPGPGQALRWGVHASQRDPETGELLHDDLLLSAALCARLDAQSWISGQALSEVIPPIDPVEDLSW